MINVPFTLSKLKYFTDVYYVWMLPLIIHG